MSWLIAITAAVLTSGIFRVNPKLFALARWEKEGKVYDRRSIRAFRWLLLHSPLGWINPSLHLSASRTDCDRLLKEMNASEGVHWLTCSLAIIVGISYLVSDHAVYGYVMLLVRIPFDLYPIMLHRRNRGRVYRVLSRPLRTSRVNHAMIGRSSRRNQCQNPTGRLGRLVLRNMNSRHSKVTDWGLSHAVIEKQDIILDVGCGGGRTVSKLAAIATQGKVYGVDHSTESVAIAMRTNKQWIDIARVEVGKASVSRLPFSDRAFDIVTAVETHFWWPALPTDLREVLRVLKPGGRLIIIAEVYKGSEAFTSKAVERYSQQTDMALLSVEEHRGLLMNAGYSDVQVITVPRKGWICCIGSKPPVL